MVRRYNSVKLTKVREKNCSIDDFPYYQGNGLNSLFYHLFIIILHFVSPKEIVHRLCLLERTRGPYYFKTEVTIDQFVMT